MRQMRSSTLSDLAATSAGELSTCARTKGKLSMKLRSSHTQQSFGLRTTILGVLALALSVAACGGTESESIELETGVSVSGLHAWGNYHWERSSNPFSVELGDNVSLTWGGHLGDASADWTSTSTVYSVVLNTSVVPGETSGRR